MYIYFHYFNVLAFAFSVYCFSIVLSKGDRKLPMLFLFISNFILILTSLFYWLFKSGQIYDYPHFIRVPAPFHYLVGPSIYFFVRTILYKEKRLKKYDWLHFIPFIFHLIELIPFYMEGAVLKLEMINTITTNYAAPFTTFKEGLLPSSVHTVLKVTSWCIYIFLSLRVYQYFKRTIISSVISDYNRKFNFINYYLITKYAGIVGFLTAIYFVKFNDSLIYFTLIVNAIGLTNVFILAFKFPDLLYSENYFTSVDNNRENLIKILRYQNDNLDFLENSKFEGNVLLDNSLKLVYTNKLGEEYFRSIYNKSLSLNEVITDSLDSYSRERFLEYATTSLQGKPIQIEQKFLLFGETKFTWMQLNFEPRYSSNGKIIGVSVGVNKIDTKKKMESIQKDYQQSLDDLAWSSSHLLRAPVSNLMGITQLLKDSSFVISDEERNYLLSNLSIEVQKLDDVIKDMVAKARKKIEN